MKFTRTKLFLIAFFLLLAEFTPLYAQNKQPYERVSDNILESYTGRYALNANFILTIAKSGNTLKVSPNGQPAETFIAVSQTKFIAQGDPEVTIEFMKSDNSKVVITQNGRTLEAIKLTVDQAYDPKKVYNIERLKEDFRFFRTTLEKNHPRLYEFTAKSEFDSFLDSLYATITSSMTEIQFRYFLLPVIAKVHCGHTVLSPSIQFSQYRPVAYQPFVLYYKGNRAFIRKSTDISLVPGTEVLSINDVPVSKRIENLLERVSGDGIHTSVQYHIMNQPMSWMSYNMPDWFAVNNYKLLVKNLLNDSTKEVSLKSASTQELSKMIPPPIMQNNFKLSADKQTGILNYPSINYPNDSIRNDFLNNIFRDIKEKKISNLIIDVRGNSGGSPTNTAFLLKYLMKKEFVYSNITRMSEYAALAEPIALSKNRFTGKLYILIDGGCGSSTGHFLSMVKYYKLGSLIGELSSSTYSCNNDGLPHAFPNTGLILNCPFDVYETAVNGFDHAKGIPPDFEVKNSRIDVLKGKDRVMEFALKHVAEQTN